ncbi:MAG: hypothetical protein ABFD92_11465 [Planctomycetaceae bacterium]|nr:hypothetical protein [Planctomycetaceae bacterium]
MKPRAGLLPLYLKLYDDALPEMRAVLEPLLDKIQTGLLSAGLDVTRAPICRVAGEFSQAVAELETAGADALVCLHLAYSPSLESVDALAASPLPLIMLDTTLDESFGQSVDPQRLLYNHGIHGVQDLACMLRRRGRSYEVVAGHWEKSDVLARTAEAVRAARAARRLRGARVLRIGAVFGGMGDFAVEPQVLAAQLGMSVTQMQAADLTEPARAVTDSQIAQEMQRDRDAFICEAPADVHAYSTRVGLAMAAVLDQGRYDAFSMNFAAFDSPDEPVCTVPFLEISKAMARGIGYAGEGDVLTAAMVGALLAAWPKTTFTEIFCPDWQGGSIFLSHMGEINPAVAAGKALLCEKDFPFTPARNPAMLAAAPAPGPATFVNLAPGPNDTFRLIVAPVEVLGGGTHPDMRKTVRGWIKPRRPLERFLEDFSRAGGTHHSALILGDHTPGIKMMANFANIECIVIE